MLMKPCLFSVGTKPLRACGISGTGFGMGRLPGQDLPIELLGLRKEDVDLAGRLITIRRSHNPLRPTSCCARAYSCCRFAGRRAECQSFHAYQPYNRPARVG